MRTLPSLLAQSTSSGDASLLTGSPVSLLNLVRDKKFDLLNRPTDLTGSLDELGLVWAGIFVTLGAVCVFNGYRWHKVVILVLALLAGAAAGVMVGDDVGVSGVVAGGLLAVLAAVLALPIMKYTVALFAGLAGAFAGANVWTAVGQPADDHHIGSIIGLVALGMLAFIAFRLVVIAFTSIGGAVLLVLGAMAAMLNVEAWSDAVTRSLSENPRLAPMFVGVAAVVGMVVQQGGGFRGLMEAADSADPSKKAQGKPAGAN